MIRGTAAFFRRERRILWLDLGDPGAFLQPSGPLERYQDFGLGLLRTVLDRAGLRTQIASTRSVTRVQDLAGRFRGCDLLLMNVRSVGFPLARAAAELFKRLNRRGRVVVGGIHAIVAPAEMAAVEAFDHICTGPGENIIVPLATDPGAFPRLVPAAGSRSMDEWPTINRELWPNPRLPDFPWPLEPSCGWGPAPVATVLTSRTCPWRCAFCNESAYLPNTHRRSPEAVIEELNALDRRYGPLGSVVIHDSMFFQHPGWLRQWLELYPRRARHCWPYWAAARSDTVRRWPDLFEALVRETNWRTISIGFESGSDRVLQILNKECTVEDNRFTIDLVNRIGDDLVRQGREPPRFWANVILGVPGETREDALDTMRMVRGMRYRHLTPSFFSPYPGSALGYQLMAEGKSLLTPANYHRYPHAEKVRDVDYGLLRDLLAGRFDDEVAREPWPRCAGGAGLRKPHSYYLFEMSDGRCKLAHGASPEHALEILRLRGAGADDGRILEGRWRRIRQQEIPPCAPRLG